MNPLLFWGAVLTLLGILGIVAPYSFALFSVTFLGGLLVSGALMWFLYNLNTRHRGAGGWLKPFIMLVVGLLMLLFPQQSLVVLASFVLIYLLVDAFANFYFALEYKDRLSSWFLMLVNGIFDLILAGILLNFMGEPKVLAQILGFIIGVSLLIDGILALWFGWRLKIYYEKYKKILEE
ncbi:MAG TPA: hypothetical protein EYH48_05755 [Aquifex aeolicus]|uniref:DUF308 domain-containing protein n=1 Tax=Aquifex aeolicus TaxID=63363 RepID=A0A9D0YNY0_AQUAO|nr:hypothetical protein [Aquificales bacterium]HIP97874.1 hypothetical protein [Aquifex aeolicus]HIQ26811.1 hypothetical protein [Aquifex aeolicus]